MAPWHAGLEGSGANGTALEVAQDIEAGPDQPLGNHVLPNASNATGLAEVVSGSSQSNASAKSNVDVDISEISDYQPPELDSTATPPPLITPSGKVAEAVGSAVPVEQAVQEAIGVLRSSAIILHRSHSGSGKHD